MDMKKENYAPNSLDALILRMLEIIEFAESLQVAEHQFSQPRYERPALQCSSDRFPENKMLIYWIGCAGLQKAAQRLGTNRRIDRIGCTTERDLAVRLSTAGADAYGSWTHDAKGVLSSDPGFERWIMQRIGATRGSLDPAVIVRTRSIEVQLPEGMSRRYFDRALHVALKPWCLADCMPAAARYTRYSVGVERMSKALELYVGLDPRHDGDRLLGLVEGILNTYRMKANPTHATSRVASIADPGAMTAPREEKLDIRHCDEKCQIPSRSVNTKREAKRRAMSPAQRNAMCARKRWLRSSIAG